MTEAQLSEFKRFYASYGKKQQVGSAKKAFAKLNPDTDLVDKMIEAATIQKEEYLKANGPQSGANAWKFMPLPASWINAEAYENEVVAKKTAYVKRDKICGAHHCTAPATNAGKLGVFFCVDHWDGHDPERADRLKAHFISLGIRQDENGSWKGPCMAYMKRLGGFGGLVGNG